MKQLLTLIIAFMAVTASYAQVPEAMNDYKYVVVDPVYTEDRAYDPYGIGGILYSTLSKTGLTLLTKDESNWPEDLKENPCLGVYTSIDPDPNMMGKYKVKLDFENCKGVLVYRTEGGGRGYTSREAFSNAAIEALKPFKKFDYEYTASQKAEKKQEEKKKEDDQDDDKPAKMDMDELIKLLNSEVGQVAGLYKVPEGEGKFTLALLPEGKDWKVVVFEAGHFSAEDGEILGTLKKATISGIYNMHWDKFPNEETLVKWDKEQLEISQPAGAGQESTLILLKYIPDDLED